MRKLSSIIAFILLTTSVHAADTVDINEPSGVAEMAVSLYRKYGRVPTIKEYNLGVVYNNLTARYYGHLDDILPYHFPYKPLPPPESGYTELFKEMVIWRNFEKQVWVIMRLLVDSIQDEEHIVIDELEHREEIMEGLLAICTEEAKEYIDAINKSTGISFAKTYIENKMKEQPIKKIW